jgi:hypothetical protein
MHLAHLRHFSDVSFPSRLRADSGSGSRRGRCGAPSTQVEQNVPKILSDIVQWVRQEAPTTQALIQAFIAVGIAFQWWHWSDAQTGAVVGITAALLGLFVRSQVTPLVRPMTEGRKLIPDLSE